MQPGPAGYGGPPPRPKGPSLALVVIVLLAAALFFVPFVIGGVIGFMRYRDRARAPKQAEVAKLALSERYRTKNGLITAHYPLDFAATRLDYASITLSRAVAGGDEQITLAALPLDKSVTDDVDEFAELMLLSVEKNVTAKGGTSTRGERRETKCLGKYAGIEFSPTFTLPNVPEYAGRACFFIHKHRHHVIRYDVTKALEGAEAPLLRKIIGATELAE
jgi:hypothetical protein